MKQLIIAIRSFVVLTLLTGLMYPAVVTVVAQGMFAGKANGSLVQDNQGKVMGSALIAQGFKGDKYFWPRPSAVDYNPLPSGGTNLGPTSKVLQEKWAERRKAGLEGDLLAASASGLDPEISPKSAAAQVTRVAKARGKSAAEVESLVQLVGQGRQLGFLGERRVNVLRLNLLLDERMP